jgi:hypothetical protein
VTMPSPTRSSPSANVSSRYASVTSVPYERMAGRARTVSTSYPVRAMTAPPA